MGAVGMYGSDVAHQHSMPAPLPHMDLMPVGVVQDPGLMMFDAG